MDYCEHFDFVLTMLLQIMVEAEKRNDQETIKWVKSARASLLETDKAYWQLKEGK